MIRSLISLGMASVVVSVSVADSDDVWPSEPELAAVLPEFDVYSAELVSLLLPLSEIELSCTLAPSAMPGSVFFLHAELKIAVENRRATIKLKANI